MEIRTYSLGDILTLIMDFRGKTPKKLGLDWSSDGEIAAISAKNIKHGQLVNLDKCHRGSAKLYNTWMKDGDLKKGDLLLTSEAPLGEWYQVRAGDKFILSQRTFALRPNPRLVDADYFASVIGSRRFQNVLHNFATGTTVMGIRQKTLLTVPIELPDIDTQRKIGQVISDLHAKFELNQQINNNLLKLSSSIVMRASLKSDRVINLQALLDNSRKANISTDEISLDTYVSNTSLRANKRGLDTAEDYPSVKSVRAVDPGDILVGNIRPYFKKIWVADRKGGASNDVLTFRADSAVVTPEFLFGILYSDRFFDYVTATSKGTKMPRGDKQAIALYQVGLPDKDVIASVTDVVKPMLEQVSLNERQNQQLTKLRDLLLPKLLAGDIDLSNIKTVKNNA